jgi:hypothetical protein
LWCLFLFTRIVGTDLSAAITWVSLGLSLMPFSCCVRVN